MEKTHKVTLRCEVCGMEYSLEERLSVPGRFEGLSCCNQKCQVVRTGYQEGLVCAPTMLDSQSLFISERRFDYDRGNMEKDYAGYRVPGTEEWTWVAHGDGLPDGCALEVTRDDLAEFGQRRRKNEDL